MLGLAQHIGISLFQFPGASTNFSIQRFGELTIVLLGALQIGDVYSGEMEEKNIAVIVEDGIKCKLNQALCAIRPGVIQYFAVRNALSRERRGGSNLVLRFWKISPPGGLP